MDGDRDISRKRLGDAIISLMIEPARMPESSIAIGCSFAVMRFEIWLLFGSLSRSSSPLRC